VGEKGNSKQGAESFEREGTLIFPGRGGEREEKIGCLSKTTSGFEPVGRKCMVGWCCRFGGDGARGKESIEQVKVRLEISVKRSKQTARTGVK